VTRIVSRDEVQEGVAAGTITLVDALPEAYFTTQHLPGAVNLVAEDVARRAADVLPDQDAAIVTYCSNPACNNSTQVATLLENLGYRNVAKFPGGIEDWTNAGLPVETGSAAA
jgi:rhodanese-related sulfurtransferase